MCDDCINRKELLRYLSSKRFSTEHSEYEEGQEANNLDVIDFVEYMDAVDAKPVVYGKWYFDSEDDVHCDQCDWSFSMSPCCTIDDFGMSYCPNCGAKMSYEQIRN